MPQPGSFDARFHETRPGLHRRIARDVRLMWFLAGMAWKNLAIGSKVRKRYRAARAAGEPYWLDEGN